MKQSDTNMRANPSHIFRLGHTATTQQVMINTLSLICLGVLVFKSHHTSFSDRK